MRDSSFLSFFDLLYYSFFCEGNYIQSKWEDLKKNTVKKKWNALTIGVSKSVRVVTLYEYIKLNIYFRIILLKINIMINIQCTTVGNTNK